MAAEKVATVEGFDELFKNMDALAEEIGKGKTDRIWKRAMGYAMYPVLASARSLAARNIDTGQLYDHIYMKVQRPQARDKASASYRGEMFMASVRVGPKREDSTAKTYISAKGRERVIYNHRPVALAIEFGTAKMKKGEGTPFMRPALKTNLRLIQERLGRAIWFELEWGKWAKKG